MQLPDNAFYWVGLYLCDRAYGGHEEGGWWFDYGQLVTDRGFFYRDNSAFIQTCHITLEAAIVARDAMREAINAAGLNDGRRDISSVLSEGIYDAVLTDADAIPAFYPDRKPTYA